MLVHGRNGKFLLIVDLDSDLIVIHVRGMHAHVREIRNEAI